MRADPTSARRGHTPLSRKLLLAAGTMVVVVALLEGVLWLFCPLPPVPADRVHKYLPTWTAIGPAPRTLRTDPGPLAGVAPGVVEIVFNSFGFLYPEERHRRASPDELRVAVVGGSTTECSMLAADKRWPAVLEARLRAALARPVAVLNLGISAQDTRAHLATTSHVVTDLDVDVCIFLLGANDLGIVTSSTHPMLEQTSFQPAPKWSRLAKVMLRQTQLGRYQHHLTADAARPRTTPYFHEEALRQASLPPTPEEVKATPDGLAHYARNVVSLAGLCQAHGIAVLFATQPCLFAAAPSAEELRVYWGCHTGTHAITAANFTALLAVTNDHLRATCAAHGYACVDLAGEVPKGLGWFYDQVHFNEAGAARVAEALVGPVRVAAALR